MNNIVSTILMIPRAISVSFFKLTMKNDKCKSVLILVIEPICIAKLFKNNGGQTKFFVENIWLKNKKNVLVPNKYIKFPKSLILDFRLSSSLKNAVTNIVI